jgi:uncharacterized protein YprB with RNaseH-like and TPR domain
VRIENSFIPVRGVGGATERDLWERGITHWDAFEPSAVGPTTADRIESFIAEARTALEAGDARYFGGSLPGGEAWRLYENFRDEAVFFDIETTGLSQHRDDVTTVSVHRGGDTRTLVADPDPPVGEPLTRQALAAALDAPLVVTFNGKQFDVPFLETSYDLSVDVPHLDLRYPCRRLDLTGGLKPIERAVGIDRDEPDVDGREAVRLWHRYEGGDREALRRLVRYNRDDAANLRALGDEVAGRLHDRVFADYE